MSNHLKIAVIPGDGIGKEVVPEGLRVLEAAAGRFEIDLAFDRFDFASCDYYAAHGKMMPDDWKAKIGGHDAIFFGAVGWPDTVPDHISLWGSLLQFRREFDQYVNLRPVRLMPGVPSPLAGRKPGDIDFFVVRENTEGEYSSIGGKMYPCTEREIVIQETVMSRIGVDRILRYAFDLAQSRGKKHLTSATKSNGISITMPYWDERVEEMGKAYPDVRWDKYHIDILCAHFVLNPDRFDVVVASNLFGDILSDLGPACTGTIGIAPSGNINPERKFPSLFEPVHGSAPDIAGKGIANPIGQVWAGAMMLDHLGHPKAAAAIVSAIETVLADPASRTRDLGGTASAIECGKAIEAALKNPFQPDEGSMSTELPIIALTPGDCTGIGPEQTARILSDDRLKDDARIVVVGDARVMELGMRQAGVSFALRPYARPSAVDWSDGSVPIIDIGNTDPALYPPGKNSAESGRVTGETLSRAIDFAKAGEVDGVSFAPLNKRAMYDGGWKFPDEHKMFAHLLGHRGYFSEMNVLDNQWMSRVTSHVSLRQAVEQVTGPAIEAAIELATTMMRKAGIEAPRLAVAALNPHGGESGLFGMEEIEIIRPAVQTMAAKGYDCQGPFPSDTVYLKAFAGDFDGVLAMYHDQGQIATKMKGFNRGVTVTAGLETVFTTPAHGTAFDIVGQGIANTGAIENAIKLASRLIRFKRSAN